MSNDIKEYTNRELGIILDGICEKFDAVTETINQIHTETKLTNGSVTDLKQFRSAVSTIGRVFLFVIPVFVPLIWYLIYDSIKTYKAQVDERISTVVERAIQENNNKFFDN